MVHTHHYKEGAAVTWICVLLLPVCPGFCYHCQDLTPSLPGWCSLSFNRGVSECIWEAPPPAHYHPGAGISDFNQLFILDTDASGVGIGQSYCKLKVKGEKE